jgi:hypothetical protein
MPAGEEKPGTGRHQQAGTILLAGAGALSAQAEVLSLDAEAAREKVSFADRIAMHDAVLRQRVATPVVWTLISGNFATLIVLSVLAGWDQINIGHKLITPDGRIITPHVIMALLGATTVQVGTIAAVIIRYLFPGRSALP